MKQKVVTLLKKRSVTVTIVAAFTILVILPYLLLVWLAYGNYRDSALESLGQTAEDSMISVGTQINLTMRQIEDATMAVYYGDCVDLLSAGKELSAEEVKRINTELDALRLSNSGIRAAYIQCRGDVFGGAIYRDVLQLMETHNEDILAGNGRCQWFWTHELGGRAGECKFIIARALNGRNKEQAGILYVVVDNYALTYSMRRLTSSSTKYLTDEAGLVIYCSDQELAQGKIDLSQLAGTRLSTHQVIQMQGGEKNLLAVRRIVGTGWYCVSILDVGKALNSQGTIPMYIVLIAVCYGLLLLVMIYLLNHYVFRPLTRLKNMMDEYADGSLIVTQLPPIGIGEFRSLSTHFNLMTGRIDALMRAYQEETEEKNRQSIRALTAQMTPHFIYNALNTIKWMAVLNHQDNIQNMVESLIYIFQNVARADDETYTVADELTLVENYAVIQKARFMNFELKIDCEEACRPLRIRKLLIQPIVENAIIHGLGRGTIRDTTIVLCVWMDTCLHVTVSDSGCGFDVQAWRERNERGAEHTNLGIRSIEEMIRLSYGPAYSLGIESQIGGGTVVTYCLPIIGEDAAEGEEKRK